MSKTSRKKLQRKNSPPDQSFRPWISMKSGRLIILAVSIAMAILTWIQAIPLKGLGEGLLWGLIFGGMIWLIFEGFIFINRFLRRIK